jgi:hypothetical protein
MQGIQETRISLSKMQQRSQLYAFYLQYRLYRYHTQNMKEKKTGGDFSIYDMKHARQEKMIEI